MWPGFSFYLHRAFLLAMKFLLFLTFVMIGPVNAMAQGSFIEVSQQAGLDHYQKSHLHLGGGVAIFDFDNDGWEDIYLTGGELRDKLYRNNGDGTFSDVGIDAGFGVTAGITTHGVVTGDIDNDGYRDILILTELGFENLLFRNNGDGTFSRLVTALGESTTQRATSAAMGDVNSDGLLDIYITNYVSEVGLLFDENNAVNGFSHQCDADRLFINNGDLTFTESSTAYGIDQQGCGLATSFTDYDNDGIIDIMVVNDFGQWLGSNALYRNQWPDAAFEDVSAEAGIDDGFYGMGIAIGDYDRDGDLDHYVTNIGRNYLYRNEGGSYTDVTADAGVLNDSVNGLNTTGWATFFFDHDNDGLTDLFIANGEIPSAQFIANSLEDPDKLFLNNGDGSFTDVTESAGLGSTQRSRGAAFGDLNNDGRLDLVVNSVKHNEIHEVNARVYLNNTENGNHFIRVKLAGTVSNRDGFGSRVRIVVNGQSQMVEIDGGSGHASHNSTTAHFGLGTSTVVDSIIVRFPSGITIAQAGVEADQTIILTEDLVTHASPSEDSGRMTLCGIRCVRFDTLYDDILIRIFDLTGRELHRGRTFSDTYEIPTGMRGCLVVRGYSSTGNEIGSVLIPAMN